MKSFDTHLCKWRVTQDKVKVTELRTVCLAHVCHSDAPFLFLLVSNNNLSLAQSAQEHKCLHSQAEMPN